jgi:hypothetical protein
MVKRENLFMVKWLQLMKGTPLKSSTTVLLPPAPSLLTALRVGFDAIANHLVVVLFPVALDLLLWMGPRLRLTQLIRTFANQLLAVYNVPDEQTAELLKTGQEMWLVMADRFNLFSALRTYPIGVSSLFASFLPESSPLGKPVSFEIFWLGGVFLSWALLSVIGLALGSLYFSAVSQIALQGKIAWRDVFQDWPRSTLHVFYLTLFWAVLAFILSLPVSIFTSLALTGVPLAQCMFVVFLSIVFWLIIPLFFSPHGIFVLRQTMRDSLRTSVNISRRSMPITLQFILVIVVISVGMNILWMTPEASSWWMVIGVLGHAFVMTALLAASFVYFRDAERWTSRLYLAGGMSGKS